MTSWSQFIRRQMNVLFQCDFFSVDIIDGIKVRTYHVLFLIHLGTREVTLAGMTEHPHEMWVRRTMREVCDQGHLDQGKYVIVDRDSKFSQSGFDGPLEERDIRVVRTARRSPNMNAFAERWVLTVRRECLDHLILVGERQLRYALREFVAHYNSGRNHQGLGGHAVTVGPARKRRLGGLLNCYYSWAA